MKDAIVKLKKLEETNLKEIPEAKDEGLLSQTTGQLGHI